jgi:osomolarity two-component system response regulator SSK1
MPLTAAEVDQTKRASQISITEEAGRISPGETSISKTGDALSGPLLVTLEMVHSFTGNRRDSLATTPRASAPLGTADRTGRAEPDFNGLLCRRILKHVNAVLHPRAPEEELSYFATSNTGQNRTYELSVLLARGEPMDDSTALSAEEQAARQPFASLKLDREPTLNELSVFASSLRGKRVELHASLLSVFARHLTSYLAAWGMDVSHVPVEDEPQGSTFTTDTGEIALRSANEATTPGGIAGNLNPNSLSVSQSSVASDSNLPQGDRFIIIDDDVAVLKRQLLKLRAEATPFGLRPRNLKRPTLAGRTRSSPHVRTLQQNALPQINPLPSEVRQPTAVIHFTSLAKYNHVRDVVASILTNSPGSWPHPPEVMVIPKPVGPRRFLTALHTAVQRPVVDPYFTPIATSPRSPGGGYFPPFATKNSSHIPAESPLRMSHGNDYMGYEYQNSGRRSGHPSPAMEATHGRVSDGSVSISTTAGDYLATPAGSYFSSPAVSGAGSAAQGVFVRDSSGQHMGVFFDPSKPEGKESRRTASGGKLENLRRKVSITARSTSGPNAKTTDSPSAPASPSRRLSAISTTSSQDDRSSRRSSTLNPVHDEAEPVSEATPGSITRSIGRVGSSRRRVSGEGSAVQRERSGTVTQGDRPNIRSYQSSGSQSDALTVAQVAEMVSSPSLQDISERTSRRLMAVEATRAARLKAEAELAAAQAPVKTGKGNASKTAIVVPPINVLIVEGEQTRSSNKRLLLTLS